MKTNYEQKFNGVKEKTLKIPDYLTEVDSTEEQKLSKWLIGAAGLFAAFGIGMVAANIISARK